MGLFLVEQHLQALNTEANCARASVLDSSSVARAYTVLNSATPELV
jgi:hypothetical protein